MNDRTYYLRSNQALYKSTMEMFSNKSFDSASLNDIIKDSNSNKGSFYYRFKDKKELYFALIDAMFIEQITYLNLRLETNEINSPKGYLTLLFESLIDVSREDEKFLKLNQQLFRETNDFYDEVTQNTMKSPYERLLKQIIDTEIQFKPFWKVTLHRYYGDFILYYNEPGFQLKIFIDILSDTLFNQPLDKVVKENYLDRKISVSPHFVSSLEENQIYGLVDPFFSNLVYDSYLQYLDKTSTVFLSSKKLPFDTYQSVNVSKKLSSKVKVSTFIKKELNKKSIAIDEELLNSIDWMNQSVSTLDRLKQRMIIILLALLDKAKTYVVYHTFDYLTEFEKVKLFEFLLKYRPIGSKIVVVDNHVHLSYHFSNIVSMIGSSGIVQTYSHHDLTQKYPLNSVIIKDADTYELVSEQYFTSIRPIQNSYFYSIQSYLNIIYQFEMGESCDE